ncbi:MAG: hypothetical protein QMB74_06785 [Aquiluna sp.]|jgi:hypothetical protein|tara:strand:- start:815 stop:1426 length:612 start_codon:yes stop_codon:yes gene_type:complete
MAHLDPVIIRRRRVAASGILAILVVVIWLASQLLIGQGQAQVDSAPEEAEVAVSAEITDCAPGVVSLAAMVGTFDETSQVSETLNNFSSDAIPYLWYEVTNTGLVDCRFNVGSRVTFFTITSGEQTYYSSRDCDRSDSKDLTVLLQANVPLKAESSAWDRVYSSSEGCSAAQGMQAVPGGGATYKLKVELNGVISEDVRFILN